MMVTHNPQANLCIPGEVNNAYWLSLSGILGGLLQSSSKISLLDHQCSRQGRTNAIYQI